MTKILYLPTGRYLNFYVGDSDTKIYTEILEESRLFFANGKNRDYIIDWLTDPIRILNKMFLERNNISKKELPIPRNLMEIIYD